MPNYSYECQNCHHTFVIMVSIKDMEKGCFTCSQCGSKNTKRLFDGFGYVKGSNAQDSTNSGCSSCQGGSCSTCNR